MSPPFNLSDMHLVRANTQAVIPSDLSTVVVSGGSSILPNSSPVVVPTHQMELPDWVVPGVIVGVVALLILGGEL